MNRESDDLNKKLNFVLMMYGNTRIWLQTKHRQNCLWSVICELD